MERGSSSCSCGCELAKYQCQSIVELASTGVGVGVAVNFGAPICITSCDGWRDRYDHVPVRYPSFNTKVARPFTGFVSQTQSSVGYHSGFDYSARRRAGRRRDGISIILALYGATGRNSRDIRIIQYDFSR
jgi:hypothetical protein